MNSNYIQITVENISTQQSEILIAQLSELGFEGFEEEENKLSAFIPEQAYNEAELDEIMLMHQLSFSKTTVAQKNWNEDWEKNFEPVSVDDFVAIRAHFHAPQKNVLHEIIITPKMSFGTGHHATTYLMMQQMRSIDFTGKSVFDFGTGTGVLAILAEKLGAISIVAIDNDEWSIDNAAENIERNGCKKIHLQLSEAPMVNEKFEVILANINKNIILQNLQLLANGLATESNLLLSGLLQQDEADILLAAGAFNLKHLKTFQREKWICVWFAN